jgi:hypothetical protein
MSTDYSPLEQIPFSGLFDGRLEAWGLWEHFAPDQTTEHCRCLTDGNNYIWVYSDERGFVSCSSRYGANAPAKILRAISEAFDVRARVLGFDTQEEWDAFQDKIAKEHQEQFHIELLKHLRGEANSIQPGTNGMRMAQIAEKLVAEDPNFCCR